MPQYDEFSFEGKKPVKNPFVPIGTRRAPLLAMLETALGAGRIVDRSPCPRSARLLCSFGRFRSNLWWFVLRSSGSCMVIVAVGIFRREWRVTNLWLSLSRDRMYGVFC
jgi:hypothetical protein